MVSCLTFRSFIHFEFTFVYGLRKCSTFILLHIAAQFSQHHLLKSPSFTSVVRFNSWACSTLVNGIDSSISLLHHDLCIEVQEISVC